MIKIELWTQLPRSKKIKNETLKIFFFFASDSFSVGWKFFFSPSSVVYIGWGDQIDHIRSSSSFFSCFIFFCWLSSSLSFCFDFSFIIFLQQIMSFFNSNFLLLSSLFSDYPSLSTFYFLFIFLFFIYIFSYFLFYFCFIFDLSFFRAPRLKWESTYITLQWL